MKYTDRSKRDSEMDQLCTLVRTLAGQGDYEPCLAAVCRAMQTHPHAPQPHNLMGVVLEKMGDHLTAMKHFRAAWALDSSYLPANHNLNTYGTFSSSGTCAFDESDVPSSQENSMVIEYDEWGIGRVVRR